MMLPRMTVGVAFLLFGAGTWSLSRAADKPSAEQVKFFETQVQPILKAHCFSCHGGAEEGQGRPAADLAAEILKGGNSGPVVLLDKPEESLLLDALSYEGREDAAPGQAAPGPDRRPDPLGEDGPALAGRRPDAAWSDGTARRRSTTRPAASGRSAPWLRPTPPAVKRADWVRNPIDAFVLARLEAAGLPPAPPASKAPLLRRVYYDLTGLPPTPAEVDAFLADQSPDAYEKVVDRLLASPHYGEHWGRHWLDLVRYAETNSFERDGAKPFVWRYRDYVIRSFNQDKPYDRFIREQLAGDELDTVTDETHDRHRLLPPGPLGRRAGRSDAGPVTTSWTTSSPPPARRSSA